MTGICGLLSKRRLDEAGNSFDLMVSRLARYPHGSVHKPHIKPECALASVRYEVSNLRSDGHWTGSLGDWVFVGEARLDNRESVAMALGYDVKHRHITDEQLVCESLLIDDYSLLASCFGDWVVAGFNRRSEELLIAREPYGSNTLYYHNDESAFAFASSMDSLLAFQSIPRIADEIHVVRSMTRWPSKDFSTVFKGVYFLPPATVLKWTNKNISLHRYWKMEDCIAPLKINYNEAAQELLLHMKQAVACRLPEKGQVATMLSSGLDSSSITAIASEQLHENSRQVYSYSLTPLFKNEAHAGYMRISDESDLAFRFAQHLPNCIFTKIDASEITPIEGLRKTIMAMSQPFYATSNDYWMHSLFARAAADGNRVLFNGGMGNLTFSWGFLRRTPAWRLFVSGRRRALYQQFKQLNPAVNMVKRARVNRKTDHQPWRTYSIVNPQYCLDIGLYDLMRAEGHDPSFYSNIQTTGLQERLDWISPEIGTGILWDMVGRTNGLDVVDPTADARLMLFTLCLPEHIFTGPQSEGRWLAREAMRAYLPDFIRLRTARGLQAADLNARLLADREGMEELLAELNADELVTRLVDFPRMKTIWNAILKENTVENQVDAWSLLFNGLAIGIFLTSYQKF